MMRALSLGVAAVILLASFASARAGESTSAGATAPWITAPAPAEPPPPVRKHVRRRVTPSAPRPAAAPAAAVATGVTTAAPAPPAPPPARGPEAAWAELLAGNARFVAGRTSPRPLPGQRQALAAGQHPRAVVLTCSDSRVPPELIFDQSLGDLFVVRTAGQVVDDVAVGSIEYAVEHLGAELVVVLGHDRCGAVTAALSDEPAATPALTALVGHIRPTVQRLHDCFEGEELLDRAVAANVGHSARELLALSPVLRQRLAAGTLAVVKARYGLSDGEVHELGRPTAPETSAPARRQIAAADSISLQLDSAPPAIASGPVVASLVPASVPASSVAPRPVAPPANPGAAVGIGWEGQLRYRYEYRSVLDYRLPGTYKRSATQHLGDRGDVSIMRTRLGGSLRFAPGVRGYFNLQDARTMGAEGSPGGTLANVDLFLAYVDVDSIGARPVSLRVGRQVLAYGDARLVSGADWGNAGRGYDGARLRLQPAHWQIDAFGTWLNEGRTEGSDRVFSGLDALWRGPAGLELEGYVFARTFGDTGFVAESGRGGKLYDRTTGARARGVYRRVTATTEAALQRGQRAGDDVRAWFSASRVTVELPAAWKPRAFGEIVLASGDRNPTDGTYERFDPMYWGAPLFQGRLLLASCGNMKDYCGGLTFVPWKSWSVTTESHNFTLMQANDAWVDAAGNVLRRDVSGGAGTDLGHELDLMVKWDPRARLSVLAGGSHLWCGSYVDRTGGGSDTNWAFLQLAVSF